MFVFSYVVCIVKVRTLVRFLFVYSFLCCVCDVYKPLDGVVWLSLKQLEIALEVCRSVTCHSFTT